MINTIKTFLIDVKENLIENQPMKIFIGMNSATIVGGMLILMLLKMIPQDVGDLFAFIGLIGVNIFMISVYFWGKRHPNKKTNQKTDINEIIAFFFGILSGSFFVLVILLSLR